MDTIRPLFAKNEIYYFALTVLNGPLYVVTVIGKKAVVRGVWAAIWRVS